MKGDLGGCQLLRHPARRTGDGLADQAQVFLLSWDALEEVERNIKDLPQKRSASLYRISHEAIECFVGRR